MGIHKMLPIYNEFRYPIAMIIVRRIIQHIANHYSI